jgi:hypothetical protein
MNFEQTIQQWLILDNQIKTYNEKLKELRLKQNNIEETLTNYANDNHLLYSTIKTTDGKLKFVNTKFTSPLTFRYLEKSLGEIIKNPDQVKTIIHHIKNNRDSKIIPELKRFYNN